MPDTLVTTSLAGATAAVVEATLTYPLEYLKTRQQLIPRPSKAKAPPLVVHNLTRVMFKGCSAVVTGNATKALLRYSAYNWASKFMADLNGQTSGPQAAVAAMFTGMCESLVVVPFESIKTVMVERSSMAPGAKYPQSVPQWAIEAAENVERQQQLALAASKASVSTTRSGKQVIRPPAAAPKSLPPSILYQLDPKVHGLFGNIREMYAQRGLRAFIQGFSPTMVRQIANAMVRFTSFNFLKQLVWSSSEPIPGLTAVGLGMVAGGLEVVATQPIDVVKTRMQASNGLKLYGNSFRCSYQIFINEGPAALWAGAVPRFLRVSFSSGIMFGVYEITNNLLAKAMNESPFGADNE